jgi:hypothetical protein
MDKINAIRSKIKYVRGKKSAYYRRRGENILLKGGGGGLVLGLTWLEKTPIFKKLAKYFQ